MAAVLANAEIKTMINTFGCGFSEGYGNDFDIEKLRYQKIVIMTDADVDGAHIATLLLTFFYRFMPELITHGHVYLATPPLYKAIPKKGKETYLFDDTALEKYKAAHKGPFTLQRYKGLGEMDASQLWETTLDPETRTLKQIEIEDARMASDVTSMLMGSEVPPRRQFIYDNAEDAMLDIQKGREMAEHIIRAEFSEVMQKSYIDYAMSVICARALPDIRDGLKPVQRRVLYAMDELNLRHDRPHRKSARIVGDTMGKYHPHGDSSIYESLVVMEQEFKKGMPLVDGHGNFGSIEGDGAAAMRYTEARLKKFTQEVYLMDLDKNVVDFISTFDETRKNRKCFRSEYRTFDQRCRGNCRRYDYQHSASIWGSGRCMIAHLKTNQLPMKICLPISRDRIFLREAWWSTKRI